jgi:hypothetical protein
MKRAKPVGQMCCARARMSGTIVAEMSSSAVVTAKDPASRGSDNIELCHDYYSLHIPLVSSDQASGEGKTNWRHLFPQKYSKHILRLFNLSLRYNYL